LKKKEISLERAERIAKGHACDNCGEYSFKKLKVKPAAESHHKALGEVWHVTKVCGVCRPYFASPAAIAAPGASIPTVAVKIFFRERRDGELTAM